MISAHRKTLLLESIEGCSSWDDIHAKWAGFSEIDKGARFEDLTQAFLLTHETYAKEFVNIWRPEDAPAEVVKKLRLRIPEWGVDLVGETRSGEFWSIQCKYRQDTDQELTHNDISSSVATTFESSRGFSYLLVCTTTQRVTNHYDHNPKVLFYGLPIWQQIDAAFLDTLRNKLAGKKVALTPYSPRKHQLNAIQDGLKHFKQGKAARGKLIMPCGTGKSLTAWFLAQALGSKRVVIAVPSLSLVKQTLGVWTREAYHNNIDVKWICVCSDETAGRAEQDDVAVKVKDLGVPCQTAPDEIARELKANDDRLMVVFTTYQSGQVLATAARKAKFAFDLGIMDEAHKTVGDGDKLFSHLIHDHNIEIRQRVFMTATERRFSGSSDKILSMDDPEVYGETFHLLTFKKAMEVVEGERPILCDYNVITIGVSRHEVKELIQKNLFVRPDSGKWDEDMEADMLAAMVALRKAMQEYPIKHAVSFHGSIKRAEQFREYNDSFTEEFPSFGQLSTFHVSGQTPTGTRSNIIKQFAKADRSLVTNARCLTEGVDVPSIDCVLFADPKKSKVDIVQAVGRALRPAQGKKLGYVILPVLHDEDSGELKESGAFKEVIEMLAKLASQDERIIDEFRLISQGQMPTGSSRVRFEFGERLSTNVDIAQFTNELQIKCWSKLAKLAWRPFSEAREFVHKLGLKSTDVWREYCQGKINITPTRPLDIPSNPNRAYEDSGWIGWGDWLGTGNIANYNKQYLPFEEARAFVRSLGIKSGSQWEIYCRDGIPGMPEKPESIPATADRSYADKGWQGWGDWLGTGSVANYNKEYLPFEEARAFVRSLGLKSGSQWGKYCKGEIPNLPPKPDYIPHSANRTYAKDGWISMGDWLGTGVVSVNKIQLPDFQKVRKEVRRLKLKSVREWRLLIKGAIPGWDKLPNFTPKNPDEGYRDKGWSSWGDWLGTQTIAPQLREILPFKEARDFIRSLGLKNQEEWNLYCQGKIRGLVKPDNIPAAAPAIYKKHGWISMGDWLGTGTVANSRKTLLPFDEARRFVHSLGLKSQSEWFEFMKGNLGNLPPPPEGLPTTPSRSYTKLEWKGMGDWLGTGTVAPQMMVFKPYDEARLFSRSLGLKTKDQWFEYVKGVLQNLPPRPSDIPAGPSGKYRNAGWISWADWLGNGSAPRKARKPRK
jgi:superfamily II DNA or RNA helicase